MKILQLNIWGGRLEATIVELIQREQPDVVCLQEVVSLPGEHAVFISTLGKLQAALNFPYQYYSPCFSFKYMNREADFGNCVLSRHELSTTDTVFTNLSYTRCYDFAGDDNHNIRNFQHVSVATETGPLHILNHHGYHIPDHKHGNSETLRQCQQIVDYIKGLEGPVVLCGDFNLAPDSESLELINTVLVNHAKDRSVLTTRTPLTKKTEVCDYIFTSPDIEVSDFQVLDDLASDHKALTVTF